MADKRGRLEQTQNEINILGKTVDKLRAMSSMNNLAGRQRIKEMEGRINGLVKELRSMEKGDKESEIFPKVPRAGAY